MEAASPDERAARAEEARRARRLEAEAADREFEDALVGLAAEIAELRRSFGQLIEQMGRVGEAGSASARAAVRAASTDGISASERASAEVGGEIKALREELVRTAREHPWRTLGLAAAAGVIMGLVMRR